MTSLGAPEGTSRQEAEGCASLGHLESDPASAAFAGAPCHTAGQERPSALIGVDRELSPQLIKVRIGHVRVDAAVQFSEDRARLRAHLSSRAWIAAGVRR
jgi:hypothetical protein